MYGAGHLPYLWHLIHVQRIAMGRFYGCPGRASVVSSLHYFWYMKVMMRQKHSVFSRIIPALSNTVFLKAYGVWCMHAIMNSIS